MAKAVSSVGYSANVRIELHVNGSRLRVAKLGPGRIYFDAPQTVPAGVAELLMQIDDHQERWRVVIHPNGPARIIPATFEKC